jgi:hypothetical protein
LSARDKAIQLKNVVSLSDLASFGSAKNLADRKPIGLTLKAGLTSGFLRLDGPLEIPIAEGVGYFNLKLRAMESV